MKQLLVLFLVLPSFCATLVAQYTENTAYHWAQPDGQYVLDNRLEEVSGLSMANNGNYLAAIQDEEGELFFLDPTDGRIIQQIPFWKEGDYEGVEQVGNTTYVVKSTGTIYAIQYAGTSEQTVEKYNDFLNSDNDIEGLSYWPQRNQLLLACKDKPGEGMDESRNKAIYAFDVQTHTFLPEPLIVLRRDSVEQYLARCQKGPHHNKLCDIFASEKDNFDLSPAALAIHPVTGHFYLTSSKASLLFTITDTGEILHIDKLPKELHRQPEGLCFDAAGNLYIANEAKKDNPATIYRYTYHPNGDH